MLESVAGPGVFSLTSYDLGAERWLRTGEVLPDSVLAELDGVVGQRVAITSQLGAVASHLINNRLRFPPDRLCLVRDGVQVEFRCGAVGVQAIQHRIRQRRVLVQQRFQAPAQLRVGTAQVGVPQLEVAWCGHHAGAL